MVPAIPAVCPEHVYDGSHARSEQTTIVACLRHPRGGAAPADNAVPSSPRAVIPSFGKIR